jgi:BlaI family transcriptional regulator, penicillinase repressor
VSERSVEGLTRRERQIMDVVYRLGSATVAEVQAEIPDPPSYSSVRTLMRVLTEKGELTYETDGPRYVYRATTPREEARASALERVLSTFFDGSASQAMAALMDLSGDELSDEELDRLEKMIENARREGR